MQRRKSSGNADWYFFTCIPNNRMGAGNCTGMYIRESALMEAIQADAAQYCERHKDALLHAGHDRVAMEERLTAAKSVAALHIDHCQHSFEQSASGEITKEEFKAALAEKRTAEQEVQDIEAEIRQFECDQQKYECIRRASENKDYFNKAVSGYLQSVTVYHADSVIAQWSD